MSQHLITTLPSRSTCSRCGQPVLSGIDAGMSYTIDLTPLNVLGELAARVAGRCTYRIEAGWVMYRSLSDIRSAKPRAVLATHTCGSVDPTHIAFEHVPELDRYRVPHDMADANKLRITAQQPDLFNHSDPVPPF